MTATSTVLAPDTQAPEADVARDLLRRMAWVAPLFVVAGAIGWGLDGALSALTGLVIVAANFAAAAALLGWGARNGQTTLLLAVMGGYVVRLGAVLLALWGLKQLSWVEMVPLGVTLLATHLGLLIWETKYISLSLAFPGLKPGTDTEGSK